MMMEIIPFCEFVIFLINLMKTGIAQTKYCNYRLFTLFDQSLPLSLWQKFILLLLFISLIAIVFLIRRWVRLILHGFFVAVLHLNYTITIVIMIKKIKNKNKKEQQQQSK